jgi:hypothetical protein
VRPQPYSCEQRPLGSLIVANLSPVKHPFAQALLVVAFSIEGSWRVSHRLSRTVSCDPARRCSEGVDQRGLGKAGTQSSHQAQHGHPVSPHPMISRTESGDLPDDTFRALPLRKQRYAALGLDQPDVFLQAPTQTCRMEGCISTLDWHLGDPDNVPFDAHFENGCIVRHRSKVHPLRKSNRA